MDFSSLGLSSQLLRSISDAGYQQPTPIQEKAIPEVLNRKDILGIAQTGTGKTASFTLPMIDMLAAGRAKARMPRTLILEPTRELAAQVADNFDTYGKYHKLSMALLIGGVSFNEQAKLIDRGVDVLIATPGRLLDHFERGKLMLHGVEILVIDEADRMLDMGFIPDVEKICSLLPITRQTLFFSATMPGEIGQLADRFLHLPVRVEVARPASAAETVKQALVQVPSREKRKVLRTLLSEQKVANAIIFCNRKREVDTLNESLKRHGFSSAALHGDMEQRHRLEVLENFKANNVQLLVASDVAARGLDIPSVSHVFNFDVPVNSDDYIHRIGRTGRAGREGHAFMLATDKDDKYLDAIEKMLGSEIPKITVDGPGGKRPQPAAAKGRRPTRAARKAEDDNRNTRGSDGATSVAEKGSRVAEKGSRNQAVTGTAKKDHRQDTPVVGMGDHVPAFMLRPVVRTNKTGSAANNDID